MNRNLPKKLHLKNGGYYFVSKNVWKKLSRDRDEALAIHASIVSGKTLEPVVERHKAMTRAYLSARKNAVKRRISFSLQRTEFEQIVRRSNRCCEVTGIPFCLDSSGSTRRRPFAPSLDRIDSRQPYVFANCRLVCIATNMALGEWGIEVAAKISRGIVRHRQALRRSKPNPGAMEPNHAADT